MTDSTPNDAGNRARDADERERRRRDERADVPSLPELLLAIPQDDGDGVEFERIRSKLRPVDFE